MQTNESIQPRAASPVVEALERQRDDARTSLDRLREGADDAKAEAERWRVAFEREPSAEAHTEMVVAQQRAVNAWAAADQYERETLQPLEIEHARARRNAISAELQEVQEHAEEAFRAAARLIVEATAQLDSALSGLAAVQLKRAAARSENVPLPPASLVHFMEIGNAVLEPLCDSNGAVNGSWASFSANGGSATVTVRRPTHAVPGEFK